jgi:hypothetical protein
MDRKSRAVFLILAWIATIALVLWLPRSGRAVLQSEPACSGCPIPPGAMIRFELASSREEVLGILQPADRPCGRCIRRYLDAQNHVDFGFMLAYSALNLAIVLFLAPPALAAEDPRRRRLARLAVGLGIATAVAMLLGDAAENLGLLRLTGAQPDFASALGLLYPATRIKWSALAFESLLIAGLYGFAHWGGRGRLLTALALPYLAAAIYGFRAVVGGSSHLGLYGSFYMGLAVAWLSSLLHAGLWLLFARRSSQEAPPT